MQVLFLCVCVYVGDYYLLFFFFFKQKTAYEMRISDWSSDVCSSDLGIDLAAIPRITISACGTAYFAGLVAKYWFEQVARQPVEVDIASEFRYREAPMPSGGLGLFISQSGETIDTLEALRYAKRSGQKIRSEEQTSELQSLMRISYDVFSLKKKKN